jgi:aldose 1-epimerase
MWQSLQTHDGVSFSYTSKDGEEGYPGNLSVNVSYSLSKDNALAIHYQATTDAPTVLNLTNHSYFNLDGAPSILDHELLLNCDDYLPTNAAMIPSGEIRSVADTPFDFRLSRRIGDRISQDNPDLNNGGGYDHNWCINGAHGNLRLAARVYAASSGRILECYTDQPGVQFYAGNFIARNGTIRGKNGAEYGDRSGLCLETQHYPDSPNHPNFPSTLLRPGEVFNSTTVYLFGSASS